MAERPLGFATNKHRAFGVTRRARQQEREVGLGFAHDASAAQLEAVRNRGYRLSTATEPPAATLTATASPIAATVTGSTNFNCSRRLARSRCP